MLRLSFCSAALLLVGSSAPGQQVPRLQLQQRMHSITSPLYSIQGTLDLRTGTFTRSRELTIGNDGREEVYDNTCFVGGYLGLMPSGPGGTGSAFGETVGDYGAIPATGFSAGGGMGDAFCSAGCADDYDITQFEIAWCQAAAPVTGSVIELDFWNTPQQSCVLGGAPGNNPTGGLRPPATSTVLSGTLTGLPRNANIGTLACYVLNITLVTPGFNLNGSTSFAPGITAGDKFAWGFSMPSSTGADGPVIAGDVNLGTPCLPCVGTIWEIGGQTTSQGTGAGQDGTWFFEDYGGTSAPMGAGDCYVFNGLNPPSGYHLELFANKPCNSGPDSFSFCDGADGSLASCPCAPGNATSGCDTPIPAMQGGGLTGGVELTAIVQQFSPNNRATLQATGFPVSSVPGGVVFRNNGIDPGAPVVFGDGLRCVDTTASPGTFTRIGASVATGGVMENTFGHGPMAGSGTFFYQLWFRSTPISYCDPTAAFNVSNGITLDW